MTAPTSFRLAGRPVPVIGRARIYVCGITPYDTTHLGHAATFVWTDVCARVLRHTGVTVEVCRNITDVDDDLLAQARRLGVDWRRLAAKQTYRFEEDMRLLNVGKPAHEPQSHNYVGEVLSLARALLDAGAAYECEGTVWFRGDGVNLRAGLDRKAAEALVGTAEHLRGRESPLDVPVWQPSLPG
ncbi:MAG: cysteine--tRNA ligase, partial [Chloroflexota bacterium]